MPIDYRNSYTALWDRKIVGVGGISIMWSGVGEVWMILSKDSNRNGMHGVVAFDVIKKKLDEIIDENNIKRAQCTIRTDFPKAKSLIEALGFEKEGLLRKYTPDGCSVYRYAKVK